ncbi:MAG: topoisomerase DNA-binding C4 zinc finger domain-containing protein, partial [Candidatus Bathyarchaeota archaeon]
NVGIVTPYSAQAQLLSKILEDEHIDQKRVMASTIHRFQGNERNCVIFDLVEGQPFAPGILTRGPFIDSEPGKLITVAVSRAEGKFILVGNGRYIRSRFNTNDAIFQIMEKIDKNGETIDALSILSLSFESEIERPIIPRAGRQLSVCSLAILNEKNFYDIFLQDLKTAKSSVVIFSPFVARKRLRSLINGLKFSMKRGIKIYIVTRHPDHQGTNKLEAGKLIEKMRKMGINVVIASKKIGLHEKFHEKIAAIDNSVFYHGSMNILSQSNSSESMIAFRGRRTIEELAKIFDTKRVIRKYQNITVEDSAKMPIVRMVEKKLLENTDPGTCPQCGKELVLIKGDNSLYFGCPNLLDRSCKIQKEVDKILIKQAVLSMKLKCGKCLSGHMTYRDGKFGPFLGCDQYVDTHCQATMDFDDNLAN